MKLTTDTSRHTFLLTDIYYTEEESGQVGTRVDVHLCGRTEDGERVHKCVRGFRPYFLVSEQQFVQNRVAIEREMESSSPDILDYEFGHTGIHPNGYYVDCVKLIMELPKHVPKHRDSFGQTYEADVLFTDRFCVDKGIKAYVSAPKDTVVDHTEIEGCEAPSSVPEPQGKGSESGIVPRVVVYDIEVWTGGDGLPNYELADKPITAVTAHDSYTDEYVTYVLAHDQWSFGERTSVSNVHENVSVWDDEQDMLYEFVEQLREWELDVLTAWNDSFDTPYFINRCFEKRCFNVRKLSPTESVWSIDNDRYFNNQVKGIQCWDALSAFKKMQIHDLKSYSLDAVATEVLGYGKTEIESTDHAYEHEPELFTQYSLRDVEAVVEILEEEGLVEAYTNIQELTGTQFGNADRNDAIVDLHFLHKANCGELVA